MQGGLTVQAGGNGCQHSSASTQRHTMHTEALQQHKQCRQACTPRACSATMCGACRRTSSTIAAYFSVRPKPGGDSADTLPPLMLNVSRRSMPGRGAVHQGGAAARRGGSGGSGGRGGEGLRADPRPDQQLWSVW